MLNYSTEQSKQDIFSDLNNTTTHETKLIILFTKQQFMPTEVLLLTYTEKYKR
jgi:hypothetical protein